MSQNWIRIDQDGQAWDFDAGFLASNWQCIWNAGCEGIGETVDAGSQLGCCSVGAEMLDVDEAMRISALGASLDPAITQFAAEIAEGGALRSVNSTRAGWATRVVDGACIFLNRPGFQGGEGCALHLEASASGESHIDTKPSICWQLPLKIERTSTDGAEVNTLRGWLRSDWGTGGEQMAYCCTERGAAKANAFIGTESVVDSLREELDALLGEELAGKLSRALRDGSGKPD